MFMVKRMQTLQILLFAGIIATSVSVFLFGRSVRNKQAITPSFSRDCTSWRMKPSKHKSTLITKTPCKRYYFLLVLVSSAPPHLERRNLIRQTWGIDNSTEPEWKTYFLLGQTRNRTKTKSLKKEEKIYGDMIRGRYYEHYWKQSLKIEMGFEWAARYCNFSFLLKADDDVLVNTRNVIPFLQRASTPKMRLYMGRAFVDAQVQRLYGKHRVNFKEFAETHYPPYCTGAGFVLSYDMIECFVPFFDLRKPFRIDDVYVGILASKIGVTPLHHDRFIVPFSHYDDCYFVPNTFIQHRVLGQCLITLFEMHSKDFYASALGSYF